jgi:prepilin-type N-terminal cleavage/methylation domain-containing protein
MIRPPRRPRALTLIELLVAITIILILAAIIITALVQVRKIVKSLGQGAAATPTRQVHFA